MDRQKTEHLTILSRYDIINSTGKEPYPANWPLFIEPLWELKPDQVTVFCVLGNRLNRTLMGIETQESESEPR